MATPTISQATVVPNPVTTQATVTITATEPAITGAPGHAPVAAVGVVAAVGAPQQVRDHKHYTLGVSAGSLVQSGTPSVWTYTVP